MPHINYREKEIAFKIVYYGPGFSGKTTNLKYIHGVVDKERKGEMLVLDTAEERTLFFDFFPLDLGRIEGYAVRINIYTVPGQVYYEASRRLIVEGADGIVFVVDSQTDRLDENIESLQMLRQNIEYLGFSWDCFPLVMQYNKRDMKNILEVGTLEKKFQLNGIPVLEAVATSGVGVMETIRIASRQVIEKFQL